MKKLIVLFISMIAGCAAYVPPTPITKANYTGGVYDGRPSVRDSLPFQPERPEEGVGTGAAR